MDGMFESSDHEMCQHCGGHKDEVGPVESRHIGEEVYITCKGCFSGIRRRRPKYQSTQ